MSEDLSLAETGEAKTADQVKEELLAFAAPYLEEKLLQEGSLPSRTDYQKAFTELKKYLWLCAVTGGGLPMTSRLIDEVWHQFILFTREYHEFCDRFFDGYMHHTPHTSHTLCSTDVAAVKLFIQHYKDTCRPPGVS